MQGVLFLPRLLKHYRIHINRKKNKSPTTTPCCPHRFFFPLESGWKRPWDTCDILLHSLMHYWQLLGCYCHKGGKRAYIEEISQGFGRKKAKWQSNWLKNIEGAQRGLYKKHLPVKMLWVYIYLPLTIFHKSDSTGSCKFKHAQNPWISAWPCDPIEVIICHCTRAPESYLCIARIFYAVIEKQNCICYLKLLGEPFYYYLQDITVLAPSLPFLPFLFWQIDPKIIRNLDCNL